jgi:short subunit dehydrogenase-like uncharacterized protein
VVLGGAYAPTYGTIDDIASNKSCPNPRDVVNLVIRIMVTKTTAYAGAVSPRPHSITVFGCTGNAGRAVAYHCVRSSAICRVLRTSNKDDDDRRAPRIALAGRDRGRVARVLGGIRDELRAEGALRASEDVEVGIVVADVADYPSMLEMAETSTVVVSCVGPYGRYGEAAVRACVEGGAHYVDITGEVPFVERMISDYGEAAAAAGVTMCPFSGYDCVPAELGMWLVGRALELGGGGRDGSTLGALALNFGGKGGGFPRGTLETILDGIEGKGPKRREGDPRFYPEEYRETANAALSLSNFALPKYQMGTFTGPNFMSVVNVPVLCRAAPTLGFAGDRLAISDRFAVVACPTWRSAYGLFVAQAYIAVLIAAGAASMIGPLRARLRRGLETYSYGGDPSGRVFLDVRGYPAVNDGSYAKAECVFPGDPGIYATGLFAAGVAGALLEATAATSSLGDAGVFPAPLVGFHSPVAALHVCRPGLLVDRLREMGARITVEFIPGEGVPARAIDVAELRSKL